MKRPFTYELVPLYLATLLVVAGSILSYRDWRLYSFEANKRHQASAMRDASGKLLLDLTEAETGQRGYLLTGDPTYLRPYQSALQHIKRDLASLHGMLNDPKQAHWLVQLDSDIQQKLAEMDVTIQLQQAGRSSEALQTVKSGRGVLFMNQMRAAIQALVSEQNATLRRVDAETSGSAERFRWFAGASVLSLLALLVGAQFSIRKANQRRDQLISELDTEGQRVAEARDLLDTTLRSIGDAVIATDREGRITFLNNKAQLLTGWSDESALGLPVTQVYQVSAAEPLRKDPGVIQSALQNSRELEPINSLTLLSRDGQTTPVEESAAPIRSREGSLMGAILVFRDVTERRAAEEAREQHRRELEQKNNKLAQVNADLELFANAAGHDLHEPLRAVASFAQLAARKKTDDPEMREYMDFIQEGVKRMQQMIGDLLDYSRLSRTEDQQSDVRNVVSLGLVVNEALSNCRASVEESRANVVIKQLPTLRVDHSQMVQLFQNLLSNALKYRGDRAPEIVVWSEAAQYGGWTISVADNGIGFEMQYADEIFRVFRRLHARDEFSGTGIGLATCKRIVEIHGGRISVQSEPGVGSTFHIWLPPNLAT